MDCVIAVVLREFCIFRSGKSAYARVHHKINIVGRRPRPFDAALKRVSVVSRAYDDDGPAPSANLSRAI